MDSLGIIACQVFEKELAYLMNDDERIKRICARPTKENLGFSRFLTNKKIDLFQDLSSRNDVDGLEIVLEVLPIGLHVDIEDLIIKRTECIDFLKEHADRILMLYGMCGDSSKRVLDRDDIEIIVPKDKGEVVDDCICSVLGKDEYFRQLKNIGSLFMIPGFALHWREMTELVVGQHDMVESMKMVLEAAGYKRSMMIDHDLWSQDEIDIAVGHSETLGLPTKWTKGGLDILREYFNEAIGSFR